MSHSTRHRPGGILPMAAATRKTGSTHQTSKSTPRSPTPRLRLIVRRLPPGLTEGEFWTALGDEWRVGKGKVDWAAFKNGKVSKDPAKPSRPARAYLKVKDAAVLDEMSTRIKQITFQDAKNTLRDTCLLGPPSLEFAPYHKIASGRVRHDGRQGTIDQDQEFIDFLQSLTEPITKLSAADGDATEPKLEKVSITPLVLYIKEKKANRAKEKEDHAKSKKNRSDAKEVKSSKSENRSTAKQATKDESKVTAKSEKVRIAKPNHDATKTTNKSVVATSEKTTAEKSEGKVQTKDGGTTVKETTPHTTPAKRERSTLSAAARIQRDLGLVAREPRLPRTPRTASQSTSPTVPVAATASAEPTESVVSNKTPTIVPDPGAQKLKPTQPPNAPATNMSQTALTSKTSVSGASGRNARNASNAPSTKPTTATPQQQQSQAARPSKPTPQPGGKSAFLKHANPSQGITEETLRETFKTFGNIARCDIDKKKGLGFIDFEDADSLRKAIQASPVKVGAGQVVVLENRSQHGKKGVGQGQTNSAGGRSRRASTTSKSSVPSSPALTTAMPAQQRDSVPGKEQVSAVPEVSNTTLGAPLTPSASVTSTTTTVSTSTKQTQSNTARNKTPRDAPRNGRGTGRGNRGNNAEKPNQSQPQIQSQAASLASSDKVSDPVSVPAKDSQVSVSHTTPQPTANEVVNIPTQPKAQQQQQSSNPNRGHGRTHRHHGRGLGRGGRGGGAGGAAADGAGSASGSGNAPGNAKSTNANKDSASAQASSVTKTEASAGAAGGK